VPGSKAPAGEPTNVDSVSSLPPSGGLCCDLTTVAPVRQRLTGSPPGSYRRFVSASASALRKNDEIELSVERLALGGQGVGHCDGLVVFVDGGLPGDRVRARVTRRSARFAEAFVVERLAENPARVAAPCSHFLAGECGGCRFQDLEYELQLAA